MFATFERVIQRFFWETRLFSIFAVFAGLVAAISMVFIGIFDVLACVDRVFDMWGKLENFELLKFTAINHLFNALISFLIATAFFIFSLGIYQLFISKFHFVENNKDFAKGLIIVDFDQFKSKLAKIFITVLVILFSQLAINFQYNRMIDLFFLALGIFLVAGSVFFTQRFTNKTNSGPNRNHNPRFNNNSSTPRPRQPRAN